MAQQEVARPKDRDRNDELNRVDCGDGRPGGDFSAGIAGEVISKEQAQGETVNSVQRTVNSLDPMLLITVH
jgi:hypothetical protein